MWMLRPVHGRHDDPPSCLAGDRRKHHYDKMKRKNSRARVGAFMTKNSINPLKNANALE